MLDFSPFRLLFLSYDPTIQPFRIRNHAQEADHRGHLQTHLGKGGGGGTAQGVLLLRMGGSFCFLFLNKSQSLVFLVLGLVFFCVVCLFSFVFGVFFLVFFNGKFSSACFFCL